MDPIYVSSILTNTVSITPRELNQNINQVILNKLRIKVEGKCLEEGYIKPGSVEIVSRTAGTLNPAHFNGNIRFKIRYKADVCHPIQNQVISCIVNTIGKPGIQAYIEDKNKSPLYIMLAKAHHLNNKYFGTLKEGDHIKVKIINSEFNFCEDKIRVLAVLDTTKNSETYNLSEQESKSRSSMSSNKLKSKLASGLADSDLETDIDSDSEESDDEEPSIPQKKEEVKEDDNDEKADEEADEDNEVEDSEDDNDNDDKADEDNEEEDSEEEDSEDDNDEEAEDSEEDNEDEDEDEDNEDNDEEVDKKEEKKTPKKKMTLKKK